MTLTDQYDEYADSVSLEPEDRTAEENARLSELEERMAAAFEKLLAGCPDHIRKLHEAIRGAIDAEEAEANGLSAARCCLCTIRNPVGWFAKTPSPCPSPRWGEGDA